MTLSRFAVRRKLLVVLLTAGALFATACEPQQSPRPQKVQAGSPIPASTTEGLTLVNNERAIRGIPALRRASDLDNKAQAHAEWMARNRRLAHSAITAGVSGPYTILGENVGVGSSMQQVHGAFMASSSHRGHTLDRRFSTIGVGAARGSDGKYYVVHVFKG